jgi:hypothetical protein
MNEQLASRYPPARRGGTRPSPKRKSAPGPVLPILTFLAVFVLGAAGAATATAGPVISLAEYRARLQGIATALERGDPGARTAAGRLLGVRISERIGEGSRTLSPDLSILAPISRHAPGARGAKARELRLAAARLQVLLRSLPAVGTSAGTAAPPAPADSALLARLSARAALADLPRGGLLPQVHDSGFLSDVTDFFEPTRRWVVDHFHRLWRWLRDSLTHKGEGGTSEIDLPRLVTVLVLLLAAVLAALALLALKRRRAPVASLPAPAAAPAPARDDDPLSRRAGEWEVYARELAAAGRYREAVRAWYHAVLVALYQRGILHHRKGRTNWEYVAAISPAELWRPAFVGMTRRFESEWYGSERSSREALDEMAAAARELLAEVGGSREGEAA